MGGREKGMGIEDADCARMLQTTIVLFTGNSRKSAVVASQKLMWMLNTVSSRLRAVPARSSRGLRELTNLTVRIFGKRELSVELLCSAVGKKSSHA